MTNFRFAQRRRHVRLVPQLETTEVKQNSLCVGDTDIRIRTEPYTSASASMESLREHQKIQ